ncbi:hypothetical protein L6452_37111 [Arctium lappa]|uniref:Uncharacterized protein n=1 Tax=Arctium lappa TaxID=4217 RepID=A0ACB8Y215_ARCLA|nr:hypothetical protein L6452_37111 [Arctium lappa]
MSLLAILRILRECQHLGLPRKMADDRLGRDDKTVEEGEALDSSMHGTRVSPELPTQKEIAAGEMVVTREEDVPSSFVFAWK